MKPMSSTTILPLMGLALSTLSACHSDKAPTGQVVAKVDGEEITRRDVQAELAADNAGPNLDMNRVQPLVTNAIVERKLFVEEAKRQKLDKSPDYLAASQRAQEVVLIQLLARNIVSKITPPTQDEIRQFINNNPQMFSERKVLQIDQIRTSSKGIDPNGLRPLNTMDQVVAWLQGQKHPFQRGTAAGDTAQLPRQTVTQIEALAPGMPFVLKEGNMLVINAVADAKPMPIPDAQWNDVAREALLKQSRAQAIKHELDGLRSSAKIQYQQGFAPPPAPPAKADNAS